MRKYHPFTVTNFLDRLHARAEQCEGGLHFVQGYLQSLFKQMNLDKYQYEILEMNIKHLDDLIKRHNETEITVNN
jgi:hypothetical protein